MDRSSLSATDKAEVGHEAALPGASGSDAADTESITQMKRPDVECERLNFCSIASANAMLHVVHSVTKFVLRTLPELLGRGEVRGDLGPPGVCGGPQAPNHPGGKVPLADRG